MNNCPVMETSNCVGLINCTHDCPYQYCNETPCENGSVEVVLTSMPSMAQDANMNWVPIDTTIDLVTMSTKATPYKVVFKPKITIPAAVDFRSSKGSVAFYLKGWGFPGHHIVEESSDAVISGNKITYHLSFGRIVYECLPDKLKETIFIENRYSLQDPSTLGLSLDGLTVEFDFALPHQSYEEPLTAFTPNRIISDKISRTDTGVALTYGSFVNATLPITIDPTLMGVNSDSVTLYKNGLSGGISASGSCQYGPSGTAASYDDKTGYTSPGNYFNYRGYMRWKLGVYQNYTIFDQSPGVSTGRCSLSLNANATQIDSVQAIVNEIADCSDPNYNLINYFPITAWNSASLYNFGIPSTTSISGYPVYTFYNPGIVNRILLAKSGISNSTRNMLIAISAGAYELTMVPTYDTNGVTTILPSNSSINFWGYSSLTQNAPTINGSNITVNWVNGGGLQPGDYHKVYYKLGTGYTADQMILEGTCINSTVYNATSVTLPALAAGTYSIMVVDNQVVNGTSFAGARSNIQTATVAASGGQIVSLTGHSDAGATTHGRLNLVQPASGHSDMGATGVGNIIARINMSGHGNTGLDGYGHLSRLLNLTGHSSMGAIGRGEIILVGYVESIIDLSGHSEMGATAGGRYAIVNLKYTPIYPWPDRETNDFLERIPEMYMIDRVIMEVDELPVVGNAIALIGKFTNFNGTPGDPIELTVKVMDSKRTVLWQQDVNETHKVETGIYVVPYIVPDTTTLLFYEYAGLLEGLPVVRRIPIGVPEYFEQEV